MSKRWKRVKRRWGRRFLRARKAVYRALGLARRSKAKEAIFVGGMMRSGTNMVMDILEKSFFTDVFHEIDRRAFDGYVMRDKAVIHSLIDRSSAPCVVIKALVESHKITGLLTEFAPARAVWVYRDLDDSVNSQLVSFAPPGESLARMINEPDWDDWRAEGVNENIRAVLRQHYRPDLNNHSAGALFWLARNLAFFEQGLDKRDDIFVIRYEDCVTRPAETFGALFAWLEIPLSPRHIAGIFASSIAKQKAPEIESGIRSVCDELSARFDALRTYV